MSRVSSFLLIAALMFVVVTPALRAQDREVETREEAFVQAREEREEVQERKELKRELDEARAHGKRMQREAEDLRRHAEELGREAARAREQAEMERMRAQEMEENLRDRERNREGGPERELMERLERLNGARELLMQAGEQELANNVAERMEEIEVEVIRLQIRKEQRPDRDRPRDEPNHRRGDRDRGQSQRDQSQRDRPQGEQNRDQGRRDSDRGSMNRDRDNRRRDQQRPAGDRNNNNRRPDQRQGRGRTQNDGDRRGRDVQIQELHEQLQLLRRELEELSRRISH